MIRFPQEVDRGAVGLPSPSRRPVCAIRLYINNCVVVPLVWVILRHRRVLVIVAPEVSRKGIRPRGGLTDSQSVGG